MDIQYLGTAASEGWPALFCTCSACNKARKLGGRNIRTRSQCIIDNDLLIDMPADTYLHMLKYNLNFSCIQHILITHSHEDHFYPEDIIMKVPPYSNALPNHPLYIHGNQVIVDKLKQIMKHNQISCENRYIVPMYHSPFETFVAGDYQVTPLLADHIIGEDCYIYSIIKKNKKILYAHDTGVFPKQTLEYLQKQENASEVYDLVSLDCTSIMNSSKHVHMGYPQAIQVRNILKYIGCVNEQTKFILNHFSHNGKLLYEELSDAVERDGFIVAYDGMNVNL